MDPLALRQKEAIHLANTKFFDYLPKFCRDFLGVPVEVRKGGRVVFREGRGESGWGRMIRMIRIIRMDHAGGLSVLG